MHRLGGDEFCAILDGDEAAAHAPLTAAMQAFEKTDGDHRIDAAWGTVVVPDEGTDAPELLSLADERMYGCKVLQRGGARTAAGAALR